MAFVKYQPKKAMFSIPDYVVLSKDILKFGEELWERMGRPQRVDLFYEETSNRLAFAPTEVGGMAVTRRSLNKEVKEVYVRSVLKTFGLIVEKPISMKAVENGKMWMVELKGK